MPADQTPTRFQPLYVQVKEHLLKRIIDGQWLPGSLLPSENQLAAELGVSQGTVRKALDEMTADKVVVRRQGRGTFVSEHTQEQALFHFFRLADAEGVSPPPTSEVISVTEREATPDEVAKLDLKSGEQVALIERVRLLAEQPVVLETVVLSCANFPNIAAQQPLPNTLYTLYQSKYGVSILTAKENITAVVADAKDETLLKVPKGSALLRIERLAFSIDGRPVELRYSRCTTSQYSYQIELT